MTREQIAQNLINLAQSIAEKRHLSKIAIESLSDQMLPEIDNPGVAAVVQDAVESWAYTWLDYLQGAIEQPSPGDAISSLMSVPLEKTELTRTLL